MRMAMYRELPMLYVYNSLTNRKESFHPQTAGHIGMYVCGVTVYDDCHIGHARTNVVFDTIVRYLRYRHYQVTFVRNITDIDDKIIQRAHKAGCSSQYLAEYYINNMYDDFALLGIQPADYEPRATQYVDQMIDFIQKLMDAGFAYQTNEGDVYFQVNHHANYGQLSNQNLDALQAGARVDVADQKYDSLDFVLWKRSKPGEPAWPSPWSSGRPGWHMECSVMAKAFLGETFDIHGGGSDLMFPHHENEIAQSECGNGCRFARFWLHSGMVNINEAKMSKSLNNFFTIKAVLREYSPEVVRFFLVNGHYRSEINYSRENLRIAEGSLKRLYEALRFVTPARQKPVNTVYEKRFMQAMDNDFNTPKALAVLFSLAKKINHLQKHDENQAQHYARLLIDLGFVLGLLQQSPDAFFKQKDKLTRQSWQWIEDKIAKRNEARKQRNWTEADQIRDELKQHGIRLEDTPQGTIWKKDA